MSNFDTRQEDAARMLKRFKEETGWSFDRLARELDIPVSTVTAWVQGKRNPSSSAVAFIMSYLKKKRGKVNKGEGS